MRHDRCFPLECIAGSIFHYVALYLCSHAPSCFICIEILLEETNFKGFPVVDDMECMRLYGYVRRKELRLALGESGIFPLFLYDCLIEQNCLRCFWNEVSYRVVFTEKNVKSNTLGQGQSDKGRNGAYVDHSGEKSSFTMHVS